VTQTKGIPLRGIGRSKSAPLQVPASNTIEGISLPAGLFLLMLQFPDAGRICLGLAVAGSGAMQLASGELIRLVPTLPAWVPWPARWPVVLGMVLLAAGLAIVVNRGVRFAAGVLAGLLVASFLFQRIPEIVANPATGFIWTNPAKVLALAGGLCLLGRPARETEAVAASLLGVFLVLCGTQHVVYAGFVDTLVPAWLPPGARFWTLFTAAALVAGGIGVMVPRTRGIAALWVGIMVLLWVPLVHLRRTWELRNAFELAGVFEALALAGIAWVVAAGAAPRDRGQVPRAKK
jgi:uncharacterized membrane protein